VDPTAHPTVTAIRDAIAEVTGPSLVGLSVYGSLATGDFEPEISDIDLIAVLTDVPDDRLVLRLRKMHARFAEENRAWDDRIEVDYVSEQGLAGCRTDTTTIARISPGEPLHLVEAARDFLLDWYPARHDGIALIGPPIDAMIPPIPEAEYLEEVRKYLATFPGRFDHDASAGSQTYAILTMCRGVAALAFGERLSKREAGATIQREFPRWSHLIDRALAWRDQQKDVDLPDGSAAVAETRAFIAEMEDVLARS
jgi:hypothetical protein